MHLRTPKEGAVGALCNLYIVLPVTSKSNINETPQVCYAHVHLVIDQIFIMNLLQSCQVSVFTFVAI